MTVQSHYFYDHKNDGAFKDESPVTTTHLFTKVNNDYKETMPYKVIVSSDNEWVKVIQNEFAIGNRLVWPLHSQMMDSIARANLPGAKLVNDSLSGISAPSCWSRTYRVI